MRRSLSFIAGCVLVLCGCSTEPAAQTYVPFSPPANYDALKAVLQQAYEKGQLDSAIERSKNNQEEKGTYDISLAAACHTPDDYLGTFRDAKDPTLDIPQHNNDDIAQFVLVAVEAVVWENDFRKLGIPERIWRPWLSYYEEKQLKSIPTDGRVMAAVLNHDMARGGRSTPRFIYDPGCGSGGIDVHLELNPADGQLFLIPVFLYKVCEAQHLNPLDFKTCDRWKEIFSERVWNVSGDYMYLARWTDGVVRCGNLTYEDFVKSADKDEYNIVIKKLRSPECSLAW
jgi:hypothetical protein